MDTPFFKGKGLWIFILALSVQTAHAQNIIVEATPLSEHRIEPSRSATIVTKEELQKLNPTTVADALRSAPGVEVIRQGGVGQTTSIFIRGSRSEATLVLIDGAEVNDAMSPANAFDFSNITPNNIERIEVYHGPQSVRFGAGALGGVINIITKEGAARSPLSYTLEGGTFDTYKAGLSTSGKRNRLGYSLSAETLGTEGFSAAGSENGEEDSAAIFSGATKLTYLTSGQTQIVGTARYAYADVDLDAFGGPNGDDPNNTSLAKQLITGITATKRMFSEKLKTSLGFYFTEMDRETRNRPDAQNNTDSSDHFLSENLKLESINSYVINDQHELRVGLQWREERGRSTSTYNGADTDIPKETQSVGGISTTYLFENDVWFTDIGARADSSSTIDEIYSSRASVGAFIDNKKGKIHISYGTGYKLPSLYQLYSVYGDKNINEENSDTMELTVEHSSTYFSGTVTAFQNHYEDLIDFNFLTNKYYNISKARSRGFEFDGVLKPYQDLRIIGRYTYLDAEDRTTGLKLLRRPQNTWSLAAQFEKPKWNAFLEYRFKDDREDVDPVTFMRMTNDSYDLVNLGARYVFFEQLKFEARVENVFDESYSEVAGYNRPGLTVFAGISGDL